MTKVMMELKNCKECPFFSISDSYSSDGWDKMDDWYCNKSKKKIKGAVEWHEEKSIEIPDWCPISIQNVRNDKIEKIVEA